jgi:serine/threonine-protein kinase
MNVTIDDDVIGEGALGLAVPVDPGEHRVTVSAPGHVSWMTSVTIAAAERRTVQIPALEPEPAQPPSIPPLPPPAPASASVAAPASQSSASAQGRKDEAGSSTPVAGFIVGGAGVVALGVGVGFGLSSLASYNEADKLCPSPHLDCSDTAISERTSAESAAWVSTIAFGAGIVGLGVGAYLVFWPSSESQKTVTLRATPLAQGGRLDVSSAF